jgi:hypothetical protein
MKHLFRALLLSFLVASIYTLPSCAGEAAADKKDSTNTDIVKPKEIDKVEGWKTHESAKYTIQYPENWVLDPSTDGGVQFKINNPPQGEAMSGAASVNLVEEPLTEKSMTIEEYKSQNLTTLRNSLENFTIESEDEKTVNGQTYSQVVYSFSMEGFSMRLMQRMTVANGSGWVLTYGGLLEKKNDYFDVFKDDAFKILATFGLK